MSATRKACCISTCRSTIFEILLCSLTLRALSTRKDQVDGGPLDSSMNEINLGNGIHKIGQKLPNNRELGTQENKAVMPPRASTTPELKMSRNRTISEKAEENDKVYHTQQHVFRCTPCLTDKCVMCCRKLLLYVFYTAFFKTSC